MVLPAYATRAPGGATGASRFHQGGESNTTAAKRRACGIARGLPWRSVRLEPYDGLGRVVVRRVIPFILKFSIALMLVPAMHLVLVIINVINSLSFYLPSSIPQSWLSFIFSSAALLAAPGLLYVWSAKPPSSVAMLRRALLFTALLAVTAAVVSLAASAAVVGIGRYMLFTGFYVGEALLFLIAYVLMGRLPNTPSWAQPIADQDTSPLPTPIGGAGRADFCTNCGKAPVEAARFCGYCGSSITS